MTTIIHGDNGVVFPDSTTQGTALTTGNQTFAGVKTFASAPVLSAGATVGSATMAAPSGTAPLFGARAWCIFNGNTTGTNAPIAGGNVSTVTRNSAGSYTVNLTTAMPDSDFAYVGICPGNGPLLVVVPVSKTTSSLTFNTQAPSTGAVIDTNPISIVVFR